MSSKIIGDIVATIRLPNGSNMYQKVGVLLQHEDNDISKGPGFSVCIDKWFNPAGVESSGPGVFLSVYHPKERAAPPPAKPYPRPQHHRPDLDDDEIPF